MNKSKTVAKIIYYLFTFSIGLLMVFFLPSIYLYMGSSIEYIDKSLKNANYSDAHSPIGGFYDENCVFNNSFSNDGGIVIFQAITTFDSVNKEGKVVASSKVHNSYSGFVYGVTNELFYSNKENKSCLRVTDCDGKVSDIQILDFDSDGDDKKDCIATCVQYDFFYFDLNVDKISSINKLQLIDKSGLDVFSYDNMNLTFESQFFLDVTDFTNTYNENFANKQLQTIANEFLAKNSSYRQSSVPQQMKEDADKKSSVVILIYFICIYILGDLLLGGHYIIRFIKWILEKVFKVKFKKRQVDKEKVFGNDYYCQVKFTLDTAELKNFEDCVNITYSNQDGEVKFTLLKQDGYTATQRVKAGTYYNLHVELQKGYLMQFLPETLVVEGFRQAYMIKVYKNED